MSVGEENPLPWTGLLIPYPHVLYLLCFSHSCWPQNYPGLGPNPRVSGRFVLEDCIFNMFPGQDTVDPVTLLWEPLP